jgi:hypothetical protein
MSDYWQIATEEALSLADVSASDEQIIQIARTMRFAHDDYGEQHGHREADKGLRRLNDNEAQVKVFGFVEQRLASLESAPIFQSLSHAQRIALHELFTIREAFPKAAA